MSRELMAWIGTDALAAPLDNLDTLYLTVMCPDGSQIRTGANARQIEAAAREVRDRFGLDIMPQVLAQIERHHRSTHPYRTVMPADLIALTEPVAVAAE
jgi:hypothetical protein